MEQAKQMRGHSQLGRVVITDLSISCYADMRLNGKPLIWLLCLVLTITLACARMPGAPSQGFTTAVSTDHSQMVFKVGSAQTQQMLSGVKVTVIGRDGAERELGTTDMFGTFKVPKSVLREHGGRLVLFSAVGFFTGAMRIDDPELDFYMFDERYIQLAVVALL
jgi:hypothetical protein